MEQNTFTQADIKKYIERRASYYNRNAYQIGLLLPEEFITAFCELGRLAYWARMFDYGDTLIDKAQKLAELLPKKGTAAFGAFADLL